MRWPASVLAQRSVSAVEREESSHRRSDAVDIEDGGGRGEAKSAASGSGVQRSGVQWTVRALRCRERLGKEEENCVHYF